MVKNMCNLLEQLLRDSGEPRGELLTGAYQQGTQLTEWAIHVERVCSHASPLASAFQGQYVAKGRVDVSLYDTPAVFIASTCAVIDGRQRRFYRVMVLHEGGHIEKTVISTSAFVGIAWAPFISREVGALLASYTSEALLSLKATYIADPEPGPDPWVSLEDVQGFLKVYPFYLDMGNIKISDMAMGPSEDVTEFEVETFAGRTWMTAEEAAIFFTQAIYNIQQEQEM